MPSYEILCIATARATTEHLCNLVRKVHQTLSRRGGVIRRIENYGNRPLAYPIKAHAHKHHIGRYFNFVIHASPQSLREVQHRLHTDEGVIRFLATKSSINKVLGHPPLAVDTAPALSEAHYDALRRTTNIDYYIARTLLETGKITPEEIKALGTYTPAISPSLRLLEEREAAATGMKGIQDAFAQDLAASYTERNVATHSAQDTIGRLKELYQFAKDLTTLKKENKVVTPEFLKALSAQYQVEITEPVETIDKVLDHVNHLRANIYGELRISEEDPEGVLAVLGEAAPTAFREASGDGPVDAETLKKFFEPTLEEELKGQVVYDPETGMRLPASLQTPKIPENYAEAADEREKIVRSKLIGKQTKEQEELAFASPVAYELNQKQTKLADDLEYAVDDAIEEFLYDNPKIRALLPKGDYDLIMKKARAFDGLNYRLTYPQQFIKDIVSKKLSIDQAFEKYLAQVQTHAPNEIIGSAIQHSLRDLHSKGPAAISTLMRTPHNPVTVEMAWEALQAKFGDVAFNFYATVLGKDPKEIRAAEAKQEETRRNLHAIRTLMLISPPGKSFFSKSADGKEVFDTAGFNAWFESARSKALASVSKTLHARLVQTATAHGKTKSEANRLATQVMELLPADTTYVTTSSATSLRSDRDQAFPLHMADVDPNILSDAPEHGLQGRIFGRVPDPVTYPVAALTQERGELVHRVMQTEREKDILEHPLAKLATKTREPVARALKDEAKSKAEASPAPSQQQVKDLVDLMGRQHDLLMDLLK